MALFLLKDNNTMELVPEFLNALMDTTLMVQVCCTQFGLSIDMTSFKCSSSLVVFCMESSRTRRVSKLVIMACTGEASLFICMDPWF